MKILNNFEDSKKFIENFLRKTGPDDSLYKICNEIGENIRKNGDVALKKYLFEFDKFDMEYELDSKSIDKSFSNVSEDFIKSITTSIKRSKQFHKNSLPKSWMNSNNSLGENIIPVERALCYVPSGTAPLVSTVVMTVVPAKIAGVKEVIVTSPAINNNVSDEIVVAAKLAGADRVFLLGGAHSIFAFTYGTKSIPKSDLICGPGNKYVTEAKRQVFGKVGIDGLYGPTETLVIADKSNVLGLGGIIGGTKTSTELNTKNILLESAYFYPSSIRKTSRELSLNTDAKYRFERGIDPNSIKEGLEIAAGLIIKICGGEASKFVITGQASKKNKVIAAINRGKK